MVCFIHFFFFFSTRVCMHFCATCFMHLIPDLIPLIKFGEEFLNTFGLCCFLNVKNKVVYVSYLLISDCSKNQYIYICLGYLLIPVSKLCRPEVSNNCMLHPLCVAVTVILVGFGTLSGSSSSLYFQSHV